MNKLLYIISILFLFSINKSYSQKELNVISTDFAIRDFTITKDSIFYIKKRDAFLLDKKNQSQDHYFIGGYGLEIYAKESSNMIVTASNELVRNVSSVRFYNKKTEKFDDVFYYKKGKIIDFLFIPEAELFVLSLTNKKIVFIDYSEKPKFYKTIELNLNALSRKLIFKNNKVYFATDNGEIYEYDFYNYKKELVYNTSKLITDFIINENEIIYTTIKGEIIKVNRNSQETEKIKFKNTFISTFENVDGTLICGGWNGEIFIIREKPFTLLKELNLHKRTILKIKPYKNNIIYTSSLDKTIKKWNLN